MSAAAQAGFVALICLPALAAVPAMPRLANAFEPIDGEQPRRGVPGVGVFAVLTVVVVGSLGYTLREHPNWLPAYTYLGVLAVVLAAVDARVHRLPDPLVLPSYPVLAVLFGVASLIDFESDRLLRAFLAAAGVWLGFSLLALLPGGGLGRGDVKLSGLLAGALGWLGWSQVAFGFVAGVLSGGVWAMVLLVTGRAGRTDRIAYGPHLLAGAWAAVLLTAT